MQMVRIALYAENEDAQKNLWEYMCRMMEGSGLTYEAENYGNLSELEWDMDCRGGFDLVVVYRKWCAARQLRSRHKNISIVMVAKGADEGIYDIQPCYIVYEPLRFANFDRVMRAALAGADRCAVFTFCAQRVRYMVDVRDIMYAECCGRQITLVCRDRSYRYYGRMCDAQKRLESLYGGFVRAHASYIANFDHVKEIDSHRLVMADGEILYISERRRCEVAGRYDAWLRQKRMLRKPANKLR